MTLIAGSHVVGPDGSTLEINTYREGVAAKVGHDLVIEVTRWEATVEVDADGGVRAVALTADPDSLQVRTGLHGLKPLTDKDRGEIKKNIDSKVLGGAPISFRSTSAGLTSGRLRVEGDLTIGTTTRPATFELDAGEDGVVSGTLELVQTDFQIKPYRGLMGALKVRDEIEIVLDARLPAA